VIGDVLHEPFAIILFRDKPVMPKNLPLKANDLQDKESSVSTSPKKERIMMACKGNSVLTVHG